MDHEGLVGWSGAKPSPQLAEQCYELQTEVTQGKGSYGQLRRSI